MKNRVLIIFIVISMIMVLFSGCKSNNVVSEDINRAEVEADIDDVETYILKDSIKDIETDFSNGVIKESEYHIEKVNALILSRNELINKESEIKEDMTSVPIDLSDDIQWMSNNYENLSDDEKEIFNNLINYTYKDNNESSLKDLFIKKVYADETPDPFVSIFTGNVVLYSEDPIYGAICEPILKSAFEKAYPKYESFFNTHLQGDVMIKIEPYDSDIESFSFSFDDTFYIFINTRISSDLMTGSLYHELFHAYQNELGYNRFDNLHKFIMESTAIWATTYVDEDLGYHLRYTDAIFENPSLDIENMKEEDIYSWYQLYYFIYQEKGDDELVRNIIKGMVNETDFTTGLIKVLGKEHYMHNLMAYFGQYLFAQIGTSEIAFKDTSILGLNSFSEDIIEDQFVSEFSILKDENGWSYQDFDKAGFRIHRINIEDNSDATLTITSDMGVEKGDGKGKTGMIVFGESEGVWKILLNGRYDDFVTSIDFNRDKISELIVIYFNYDTSNNIPHGFVWDYEKRIKGEGRITINVKKELNSPAIEDNLEYTITIVEDIEKYKTENSNELGGYESLILGDVYYVSNLQATYDGLYTFEDEYEDGGMSSITKEYYGTYNYSDGDESNHPFENVLLTLPPLPSNDSIETPAIPDISEMLGGLEGMEGLEGLEGLADLGNLTQELNDANDMLKEVTKNILPPMNSLIRIKKNDESSTFHFYRQLPPQIQSEKWIHVIVESITIDSEGDEEYSKSESDIELYGNFFPSWFHNPYYDPEEAENMLSSLETDPEVLKEKYKSTQDVMSELSVFNGILDKSNLFKSINNGPFTIDASVINNRWEGEQTQEIVFIDDLFAGSIETFYVDENGEQYDITIEFSYDFQ